MFSQLKSSFLFAREQPAVNPKDVIAWWEARRPIYNLLVGSAGILSCMVIAIDALATAHVRHAEVEGPNPPIFFFFRYSRLRNRGKSLLHRRLAD